MLGISPKSKETSSGVYENQTKKAAYEALLINGKDIERKPLSLNGQDEAVDILLQKYEDLK